MKKTTFPFLVGGLVAALAFGTAGPASATSSEAPRASGHPCTENPDIPPTGPIKSTIAMKSYDSASHVGTISGIFPVGGYGTVNHLDSEGRVVAHFKFTPQFIDYDTCTYEVPMKDVFEGDTFRLTEINNGNWIEETAEATGAVPEPEATVETSISDGVIHGVFTFARSGLVTIRDADGRVVTSYPLPDIINAPADTPYTYTFALPDSGRTSTYTAAAAYGLVDHTVVPFTINDGMTAPTPAAPVIDPAPSADLSTAAPTLITAHGEPRAVVLIKSAAGKVVATKMLGTTGAAQIVVPQPSTGIETKTTFTATQTAGGATSPATPFSL